MGRQEEGVGVAARLAINSTIDACGEARTVTSRGVERRSRVVVVMVPRDNLVGETLTAIFPLILNLNLNHTCGALCEERCRLHSLALRSLATKNGSREGKCRSSPYVHEQSSSALNQNLSHTVRARARAFCMHVFDPPLLRPDTVNHK